MSITNELLLNLPTTLLDLDYRSDDHWVGSDGVEIFSPHGVSLLPEQFHHARVRLLNAEEILIIGDAFGFIANSKGEIKQKFNVGYAIVDIVVTDDYIVTTYFDESWGGDGIESGRVNIFDKLGGFLFGYEHEFGSKAVDVFDCYACTSIQRNEIMFFCYTEFPLVILNIEGRTQDILHPPESVFGAHAITKLGDAIYFSAPYSDKSGIYEWQIGSDEVTKIGKYSMVTRGLPNGKFLSKSKNEFSLITLHRT